MIRFALLPALCAVLAGCGGGGMAAAVQPTPIPCPLAVLEPLPPSLLYPADGASGVPDGNFELVIGYPSQPTVALSLVAAGAAPIVLSAVTAVPAPLPSPAATPPSSTYQDFGAPVGPLQPVTAYRVQYVFGTQSACNQPQSIGTFTTK